MSPLALVALLAASAASAAPAAQALSLDEAIRLARANRPELRAARADVQGADAAADVLRAALLPQVGAAAAWTRQGLAPGTSRATTTDALSATLTAQQLVWDFGRSGGALRAGRAEARASRATAEETDRSVVREVRKAYAEARARVALAAIASEVVDSRAREAERVAALVEVGSKPGADLAHARSDAAQAKVDLTHAAANVALSRAALARALGLDALGALAVGDDEAPALRGEEGGADALVAGAVEARPALRAARERVRASEETVGSARAAWLPALSVAGAGGALGERPDALDGTWTVGASLSWSLFDGGATAARVRQAEASRAALLAQAEVVRQELRLAVDQALAEIAGARAARAAAAEAVAAATEDLRLAEARYRTGAGTLLEVSTARSALATAAGQGVQAEWDLSVGRADLAYALGDG